jgi:hypothetical protein
MQMNTPLRNRPLQASIQDDQLVISIGIETLAYCAAHQPNIIEDSGEYNWPYIKIDDVSRFARDVVCGLLHEEEDGSTVISRCIDEACLSAVEDGSEAVDYDYQPKRFKEI